MRDETILARLFMFLHEGKGGLKVMDARKTKEGIDRGMGRQGQNGNLTEEARG